MHPLKQVKVRIYEEFGISIQFVRLNLNEAALWLVKQLIGLIDTGN